MKKLFIFSAVMALTLSSCGNKPKTESQDTDTVKTEVVDSTVVDSVNVEVTDSVE